MTDDLKKLLEQSLIETAPLTPEQQADVDAHMARKERVARNITTINKAILLDGLRALCGYVENGTDSTVKIYQDDATKNWCVMVGKRGYYNDSFESVLDDAIVDNITAEELADIAKANM